MTRVLNMSLASVMTHDKDRMCVGNLLWRKPDAKCIDNACLVCYMSRQPESMLLCLHASICASVLRREKRRREKTTVQMRGKESEDGKWAFNWLISIERLGFWERKNEEHKEESERWYKGVFKALLAAENTMCQSSPSVQKPKQSTLQSSLISESGTATGTRWQTHTI